MKKKGHAVQVVIGHVLHGVKLKQMQKEYLYWHINYRNF